MMWGFNQPLDNQQQQQQQQQNVSNASPIILLDVGGTKYYTSKQTIQDIPALRPLLTENLVSQNSSQSTKYTKLKENSYFIDRDGLIFKYILNYVRSSGNVSFLPNTEQELQKLQCESVYYGLKALEYNCQKKLQSLFKYFNENPNSSIYGGDFNNSTFTLNSFQKSVGMKLIAFSCMSMNNETIVKARSDSSTSPYKIEQTHIEIDVEKDNMHVLFKWFFGSALGIFWVSVDGKNPMLCAKSGASLSTSDQTILPADMNFRFLDSGYIQYAQQLSAGKHTAVLYWKTFDKTSYTIQGPLIIEAYSIDPTIVTVKNNNSP